jgi:putative inorganic carbon (hco3(-)) transporter
MEHSFEYRLPLKRSHAWAREVPLVSTDGPKIAFKLLLLFLLTLYSNIAVIYKDQLDKYRPALVIAVAALFMMVIELGQSRQGFRLMWPQGAMLIAFLGVCVVSTFGAIYVRHSVEQTSDFAKIVLVYLLLENVITSEKRLRIVMFTMTIGGLFPAIGTIHRYASGMYFEGTRAAWRGIFSNPNDDAYALVVLIPLALAVSNKSGRLIRLAIWAAISTYLLAIFLTFSRGGLIGLFGMLGLMGWKQKSAVIRAGMVAALLIGLIVIGTFWNRNNGNLTDIKEDTTVNQRLATFKAGGLMFLHNPLLGVGPGDSMVAYPLYVPKDAHCGCQDQLVVHNSFLQVLAETGILGFIPFTIFVFSSLYHAWTLEKGPIGTYAMALELALVGFIVCSLSGGFTYTWWPYLLAGLTVAAKHIGDSVNTENAHAF